ncbi:MAG: CARDB domain-containing protein, partial [Acidobacteriota bacterium]
MTLLHEGQSVGVQVAAPEATVESSGFTSTTRRPIVSADGRYAWFDNTNGRSDLIDFEQGDALSLQLGFGLGRWLPDGERLVFTRISSSGSQLSLISAADGSIEPLATVDLGLGAVAAPSGGTYAVLARRGGESGIFLFDPSIDLWTLVVDRPDLLVFGDTLAFSPDGSRLAWVERMFTSAGTVEALFTFDLASGTTRLVEEDLLENVLDWSPDGNRLVYRCLRDNAVRACIYDVADESYRTVEGSTPRWPQFSPDGRAIADFNIVFSSLREIRVHDLESGLSEVVFSGSGNLVQQFEWAASGHFVIVQGGEPQRLSPAGRFQFDDVVLGEGANTFGATSAVGDAAPIVISTSASGLPDLSVDLSVVPLAMRPGDPLEATVTVASVGGVGVPDATLSVAIIGPGGFSLDLLQGETLGPLAVGESVTLTRQATIDDAPGTYTVAAVADPLGAIAEADENNNRAFAEVTVIEEGFVPLLTVETDQTIYSRDDEVVGTLELLGTSGDFDGTLEILIEDTAGFVVHSFASRPVQDLAFAELRTELVSWSTGSTFAGAYRLRGRLFDAAGALAVEAFAPFDISGDSIFGATVRSDAPTYLAGAAVSLSGDFDYVAGNQLVGDARTELSVIDPAGLEVASWSVDVGALLPARRGRWPAPGSVVKPSRGSIGGSSRCWKDNRSWPAARRPSSSYPRSS